MKEDDIKKTINSTVNKKDSILQLFADSKFNLQIENAVHNGIIDIDELKDINDFLTIKKTIYEYPIHYIEILINLYKNKDFKKLFEIAIDCNHTSLADSVLNNNDEDIKKSILRVWTNYNPYSTFNKAYIENENYIKADRAHFFWNDGKGRILTKSQFSFDDISIYLNDVRNSVIEEISNKLDKEKIVKDLTKDYFYNELEKGNKEIVIIKLCVRLEAVLRCDFHFEGDFSTMLDNYCSRFETRDDESNNYDPYTPKLLNKLRKKRNNIVHSEKISCELTDDEIKECIEYICNL